MKARLKRINFDTCTVETVGLPSRAANLTIGRDPANFLSVPSRRVGKVHCRLVGEGGRWHLEDGGNSRGTLVNGEFVERRVLRHGDSIDLHSEEMVFLDRLVAQSPLLEGAIDADPTDRQRVLVWADWLQEHGDPLGDELARGVPGPASLEGLDASLDLRRLDLEWTNGLVTRATVRKVRGDTYAPVAVLLRLLSLRVARWIRVLTVDTVADVLPGTESFNGGTVALVLRALLAQPRFPRLAKLGLGILPEQHALSPFVVELFTRLSKKYPDVDLAPATVLPVVGHARLEVLHVPAGFDFRAATPLDPRGLSLDVGLWIGSSQAGSLRALTPGVVRTGVTESFLIEHEDGHWWLRPREAGLRLNGAPAVACALLPGDEIEEPRGCRFRFVID